MIEIVGAGVVGGAFGRALVALDRSVRWIDVREDRVRDLRERGHQAATPAEPCEPVDMHVICVPTETDRGVQDRGPLQAALLRIAGMLRSECCPTVVIRSTILPGTSRGWAVPLLERASGLRCGPDFRFVHFPEFLRERHADADASAPRIQVLGEIEPGHAEALAAELARFGAPVVRMSAEAAEFQKYLHNLSNAVKIAFFSEMRGIAAGMGIADEVEAIFDATRHSAEGLWHPAYGMRDWGPIAGKCLPKDLEAFVHWQRAVGLGTPILETLAASGAVEPRSPGIGDDPAPDRSGG